MHELLDRRTALLRALWGASSIALGGVALAACGGDDEPSATTTTAPTGESAELTRAIAAITSSSVVVGVYGGDTEAARREIFWDPFTKRTGVKVISADVPGRTADAMLAGKTPPKFDAFHSSAAQIVTALDDGKKPLPKVPTAAQEDLIEAEVRPYAFQSFYVAYVPATLPGTFDGDGPKTWADFFDVKRFPGKRAWPGPDYTTGSRQAALLADGVAPEDLYPLDIERAHRKIASIMDDLVLWDSYPQAQQLLTSKAASIAFAPNAQWKGLQAKGVDVEVLWSMTPLLEPSTMSWLPDAEHADVLPALALFCADPKRQAAFAQRTNYGPPSSAAFDDMPAAARQQLPNAPGRVVSIGDTRWLAANEAKLQADNRKLFS